jgi:hypothetical protein
MQGLSFFENGRGSKEIRILSAYGSGMEPARAISESGTSFEWPDRIAEPARQIVI